MTSALIEARGVSAGYHGVPAITDLDLEVFPGEIVALLGANGAGKTTTLRAISGHLPLISGTVRIAGNATPGPLFTRVRNGLGVLPEERSVFMNLTCRDNLRLGRGTIDDAVRFFPELESKLDLKAGLVSGGQQQMLALGRILAAKPQILLADELSLGLAPLVVRRLLGAITVAAQDGAAVLIVEQHARLALRACGRAYVLRRGRVELAGTASELRDREDEVVALYL